MSMLTCFACTLENNAQFVVIATPQKKTYSFYRTGTFKCTMAVDYCAWGVYERVGALFLVL